MSQPSSFENPLSDIAALLARGYLRFLASVACRDENPPCFPLVTAGLAERNSLDVMPQQMDEWSMRTGRRT